MMVPGRSSPKLQLVTTYVPPNPNPRNKKEFTTYFDNYSAMIAYNATLT